MAVAAGRRTAALDSIERLPVPGDPVEWTPVRAHFGVGAFGINAWSADAGAEVIGPHEETDEFAGNHEELYCVLRGRAAFTIADDEVDAPEGTLVFVGDPSVRRGAVAREDGTVVLVVGGRAGAPFRVAAWEYLLRAAARARAQDWEGAVAEIAAGLELHPGSAELLYHRACYASLGRRLDEARSHLDAAIAHSPELAERAERDPDLAALRA